MMRTVCIHGGDVEAWLAALFVSRKLQGLCERVVVIASGDGEARGGAVTYPQSRSLLADLGLSEETLVREADGAFLLGAQFGAAPGYVTAFGSYGAPANSVPFHHYWTRLKEAGRAAPFDAYSLGAEMARHGRFVHPSNDPKRLESSFGYGLALDQTQLAALVEGKARAAGVEVSGAPLEDAWLQIDVRALAGEALVPWADLPPMAGKTLDSLDQRAPNLSCWKIEGSPDALLVSLPSRSRTHRMILGAENKQSAGRVAEPWTGNMVSIGRASHRLPGAMQTDLLVLLAQLDLLASLLPAEGQPLEIVANEYNRRATRMMDYVADMEALVMGAGRGERDISSPSLARRIEQFRSRGRIVTYDDELFSEQDWIAALIGFAGMPERVSPLALGAPIDAVAHNYDGFRQAVGRAVSRLPDQQTYLDHLLETAGVS
ncbi:MAG: tryptophan 7-halogenase [Henriciella sp.]